MQRLFVLTSLVLVLIGFLRETPTMSTSSNQPLETATPPATPLSSALELTGVTFPVHDPTLVKDGAMYYVVSTGQGIPIHCSPDMINWENCGAVFEGYPNWIYQSIPGVTALWAPDLVFWGGQWHLYYAASTFGSNRSAIGLATNVTLDQDRKDYKWVDGGLVITSQPTDNYNTIDPNLVTDQSGQRWLVFGSFWSGIKMRKIDSATGKLDDSDPTLYPLASRPGNTAIEGAYITYRSGYYYLFVSFDFCCRGVDSTYKIMVSRSEKVTGPYLDKDNTPMLDGGGSLVLGSSSRWRGPGHNMVYIENGTYWMVYHAYDAEQGGAPTLRIEALQWDVDGWPVAPSASVAAGP
jgi:arabinan endo-1,5-alpha-L-arabinosidase